LLLLLHLGCTTNQSSIPFEYLLIFCFMVIGDLLYMFSRVFIAEDSYDTRGLEIKLLMYVHTQGLFEHVPEICLFCWWSFFLNGKTQNFCCLGYSSQMPDSWVSNSTNFALFFFFWHWNPTWILILCTRTL